MMDVSNGKERARAWPRPRGKAKTTEAKSREDQFREVQKLAQYMAPAQLQTFMEATKGTPLLPRDLWTSMLMNRFFALQVDGERVIKPMSAFSDVQDGLDLITSLTDQYLVREAGGWAGRPIGSLGGNAWELVAFDALSGASWVSPSLSQYSALSGFIINSTATTAQFRTIQISNDDGVSWATNTADYAYADSAGGANSRGGIILHATASAGVRSGTFEIQGTPNSDVMPYQVVNRQLSGWTQNGIGPVTNVRLINYNGTGISGTLTGGFIVLYGM